METMSWRTRILALRLAVGLATLGPTPVLAAPKGGRGDEEGDGTSAEPVGAGVPAAARGSAGLSTRRDRPWVQRWAPERGMIELGLFGGVLVPARDLELFEPRLTLPDQGFLPLASVAADVGLRAGYFPLRFLGIEAEGVYVPTTTLEAGHRVGLWSVRGHVVGQLPVSSIAPFVLVGAGALGLHSPPVVLGDDVDPSFHLGIGTKVFIDRRIMARLDLRDVISPRRGADAGATNSLEVLLGLSVTLGRERDHEAPPPAPAPAPAPAADGDGDGFLDAEDRCPVQPGVAPDGCPPPADGDGDGFLDDVDACPDRAGIEPDGCPDLDADGDGIDVPTDACPDQPETRNGFEDADGCPDDLPDEVRGFTGAIEGVNFETGKATLEASSHAVLDAAVKVLTDFPSVRVEVSGHTDNRGSREINMALSNERAQTVATYLQEHGIDASRITTRGAGPDEPIDSNASRSGRANNRRIEFRVLQ